eukprot:5377448-Pleurochrysis_carterae.AAC.3
MSLKANTRILSHQFAHEAHRHPHARMHMHPHARMHMHPHARMHMHAHARPRSHTLAALWRGQLQKYSFGALVRETLTLLPQLFSNYPLSHRLNRKSSYCD